MKVTCVLPPKTIDSDTGSVKPHTIRFEKNKTNQRLETYVARTIEIAMRANAGN